MLRRKLLQPVVWLTPPTRHDPPTHGSPTTAFSCCTFFLHMEYGAFPVLLFCTRYFARGTWGFQHPTEATTAVGTPMSVTGSAGSPSPTAFENDGADDDEVCQKFRGNFAQTWVPKFVTLSVLGVVQSIFFIQGIPKRWRGKWKRRKRRRPR